MGDAAASYGPGYYGGLFGPGGVGFWVFLLILALLGISWAQGGWWGTGA
ncbi:MAG: hypothetical protein QME79_10025 [Bacillota bacterium]|nr:hypothetical protein [Bacillota bacterium]